jgi:hypothetical protein
MGDLADMHSGDSEKPATLSVTDRIRGCAQSPCATQQEAGVEKETPAPRMCGAGVVVSFWRRGRDSNPRNGGYPLNSFRDCRIQPLCHLSAVAALSDANASIARARVGGNARGG